MGFISGNQNIDIIDRGCIDPSRVLEPEIKKNWSSTKKASSFTTKLEVYLIPNSNFGDIRDPYSRGQTSMNFENFPYLLVSRFQAKSPLMTLWRPPYFATFLWRIKQVRYSTLGIYISTSRKVIVNPCLVELLASPSSSGDSSPNTCEEQCFS